MGILLRKIGNSGDLTSKNGDRNETWDCLAGCLYGIINDDYIMGLPSGPPAIKRGWEFLN